MKHSLWLPAALSAALLACGSTGPPGKVELVPAPATGPVSAWVKAERDQLAGRQVVVYVGATWCEPCNHFHDAVAAGQLDRSFPRLTLLEFDFDRDEDRLQADGYTSELIPLFSLPGPDGRAAGPHIEGSIKGDGAVAEITPRLAGLLAGAPTGATAPAP